MFKVYNKDDFRELSIINGNHPGIEFYGWPDRDKIIIFTTSHYYILDNLSETERSIFKEKLLKLAEEMCEVLNKERKLL